MSSGSADVSESVVVSGTVVFSVSSGSGSVVISGPAVVSETAIVSESAVVVMFIGSGAVVADLGNEAAA